MLAAGVVVLPQQQQQQRGQHSINTLFMALLLAELLLMLRAASWCYLHTYRKANSQPLPMLIRSMYGCMVESSRKRRPGKPYYHPFHLHDDARPDVVNARHRRKTRPHIGTRQKKAAKRELEADGQATMDSDAQRRRNDASKRLDERLANSSGSSFWVSLLIRPISICICSCPPCCS